MSSILVFENRRDYNSDVDISQRGVHLGDASLLDTAVDYDRMVFSQVHKPEFIKAGKPSVPQPISTIKIKVDYDTYNNPADVYHNWDFLQRVVNNYLNKSMTGYNVDFVDKNQLDANFDVELIWLTLDNPESNYLHGYFVESTQQGESPIIYTQKPPFAELPIVFLHELFHFLKRSHRGNSCSSNLMNGDIGMSNFYLSPLQIVYCHDITAGNFVPDFNIFPLFGPYL